MEKSYLDSNGLEDGKIPAGNCCPAIKECGLRNERCPSESNLLDGPYSCAGARLWSLIRK
jgi:hypothetical protein